MKTWWKKYNHALLFCYALFYMPCFVWLEHHVTTDYFVIHSPIDDMIPFCEYFIIPYYLWFLFVPAVFIYEFFYSKSEFIRMCIFMFAGMTTFLIVCALWPNGLHLREQITLRDNFCCSLVERLHEADTCTNVFPSLHVFNTLGCLIALFHTKGPARKKRLLIPATVLSVFILMSTLFLKQHSVIDLTGGVVMAAVLYVAVYLLPARLSKKSN